MSPKHGCFRTGLLNLSAYVHFTTSALYFPDLTCTCQRLFKIISPVRHIEFENVIQQVHNTSLVQKLAVKSITTTTHPNTRHKPERLNLAVAAHPPVIEDPSHLDCRRISDLQHATCSFSSCNLSICVRSSAVYVKTDLPKI